MTTNSENNVTWAQLEREIEHMKQMADERLASYEKALEISTTETLRRLGELNHAHQTAVENWRQSLPREVFEAAEVTSARWKDEVTRELARTRGVAEEKAGSQARNLWLAGMVIGALISIMGYFVQGNAVRSAKHEEQIADVLRSRDERTGTISSITSKLDTLERRLNVIEQKIEQKVK